MQPLPPWEQPQGGGGSCLNDLGLGEDGLQDAGRHVVTHGTRLQIQAVSVGHWEVMVMNHAFKVGYLVDFLNFTVQT